MKTLTPKSITAPLAYLPAFLATALVLLVARRAYINLDTSWDTLSYHLPFIARRMGFLTLEQYQMPQNLEDAYRGFPALVDYVRGFLWLAFKRPEATNLLNIICLVLLGLYASRTFKISLSWVIIGLMAVPAVQTAASTSYVDIAANAILLIYILSLCDLWIRPEKYTKPTPWIILVASAAVAANFKLQIGLLVCFGLIFVIPPAWWLLRDHRPKPRTLAKILAAALAALILIGFNFLKNLFFYGNPIFPVAVNIGPWQLPGSYSAGSWDKLPYFPDAPQPVRWLLSIIEYRSLGGRWIPYTNGMGEVPIDNPGARMGGYFTALVFISVATASLAFLRARDRSSFVFLGAFLILTTIVAALPGSHELRYFMVWMMFLIVVCLISLKSPSLKDVRTSYNIALVGSLLFVTSVTGGIFFDSSTGGGRAKVIARTTAEAQLNAVVQKGDTICLDEWDPLAFLFSPIFHREINRERPYNVKQYGCQGYKRIPRS